jgi:hypothetical protein
VIAVAELVRIDTGGAWNKDPAAHASFRSAALALLAEYQPEGDPIFGAAHDIFGAGIHRDDPNTVGRALARYHKRHQGSKGGKP